MRVWTEWQSLVPRREDLRTMMVEEEKRAEAIQPGARDRPARRQVAYIVTVRRVAAHDASERRHV
jgi:hypothetical protein